ncbi:hypothetical protein Val02_02110 [Virgisporangium aliadipatigenens]|uniref:Anti-sigma-D factor RsdA sigma factor binding region domain-containing protein n=1 Tax=Virgisporangium aliadipatigenens TaxID=741659 RepID=A0A8J3YFW4_9ACTN|nr:hypothetical protein [Virgisporangium aliadipatigenens]GIJ43325.1 hypothetical protein Val02_02110 [Virgisporangium aliadipatigenens]
MSGETDHSLDEIAAIDELLDAVSRGDDLPGSDTLAAALKEWRTDLDEDIPESAPIPEIPPAPARTFWRRVAVGVAAASVLAGGLSIAAHGAGPDSPLWPVTKAVYGETADLRLVEHTIARARTAVDAGRYDEARRLLDDASEGVGKIRDRGTAQRLRSDIDEIRGRLPVPATPPAPAVSPSAPSGGTSPAPPAPSPSAPAGGSGSGGAPGGDNSGGSGDNGGGAQPSPTAPGGILPGLPPLPSLPVPVPTLPVPVPSINVPGLPPVGG